MKNEQAVIKLKQYSACREKQTNHEDKNNVFNIGNRNCVKEQTTHMVKAIFEVFFGRNCVKEQTTHMVKAIFEVWWQKFLVLLSERFLLFPC